MIAAFNKQPEWSHYSAEPPSGTLKLNSTLVPPFLTTLFADLLPRLSEHTSYFHTGGDEVNFNAYLLDDTVRSCDPAVIMGLLQVFFDFVYGEVVRKAGMVQVVWEEMLLDYELRLPRDVVVQSWKSSQSVGEVVGKGYRGESFFWFFGSWLGVVGGKYGADVL